MSEAGRQRTLEAGKVALLERWLAEAVAASNVRIDGGAELLAGGAVQENWRLAVEVADGARRGRHDWVLRTDAAQRLAVSLDRAGEFAVLKAVHAAGVTTAEPIAYCNDPAVIGAPFLVQSFIPGRAQAHRLVRDMGLAGFGTALAERLGEELARIHALRPPRADLSVLPIPLLPPARAVVSQLKAVLKDAGEPRPALQYVLAWLDRNAPQPRRMTLVHGDFRTGNYMVEAGQLTGVLDWEFAHWGDPHEDIGWFCARCWRFGNDANEAGGIASRTAFYRAYNRKAAEPIDEAAIGYWEILAAARWAAVAVLQGDRYRKGGEASIELVLIGLRVPEMEFDALEGIAARAQKGGR